MNRFWLKIVGLVVAIVVIIAGVYFLWSAKSRKIERIPQQGSATFNSKRGTGQPPLEKAFMMAQRTSSRTGDAYFALGMAMHPIMDFTDPLHEGFQKWSGGYIEGYLHWKAEPESIEPSTRRWTISLMNLTLDYLKNAYELSQLWELSR